VPTPDDAPPRSPDIDDFLGDQPTRDLEDWRWLWTADRPFPVRSHRGIVGRLLVAGKRLLRPLVRGATADLWDRQRVWNLVLLEHVSEIRRQFEERISGLEARTAPLEHKTAHLEAFLKEGLQELMRYDDALYSRVDQKLDRYRREATELSALLATALERARVAPATGSSTATTPAGEPVDGAALRQAVDDRHYLELEQRHRGTPAEIRERLAVYLPVLSGRRAVVDLGCGRGEALALMRANGVGSSGVDDSPEMVRRCREQGLDAVQSGAVEFLDSRPAESLDGVVSFHVIEHLPPRAMARLVRSAWRVLERGGVLLLETPNPLSIAMAASHFWRDPTHRRPIHPDALRLLCEQAGFDPVEIRFLHPFAAADRLPELDLAGLDPGARELAYRINVLRDRLDQALYGDQDYAVIAHKT
jgi:O-antigen chain-terminating methyltransferase